MPCSRGCRSAASQMAGTLSGGEQQMLAIGRALMARPRAAAPGRAFHGAWRRWWCRKYFR